MNFHTKHAHKSCFSNKVNVLLGYIPNYSNAKSLACDTANEHALTCTRETCSCSQTAAQWNQWR